MYHIKQNVLNPKPRIIVYVLYSVTIVFEAYIYELL